ncbi:MAG TPA: hypothetical protein VIY08_07595 [Candidatus Nitrosocosmicus sp.]
MLKESTINPDYSTINNMINRLDITLKDTIDSKEFKDEFITINLDSTRIKVIKRSIKIRKIT